MIFFTISLKFLIKLLIITNLYIITIIIVYYLLMFPLLYILFFFTEISYFFTMYYYYSVAYKYPFVIQGDYWDDLLTFIYYIYLLIALPTRYIIKLMRRLRIIKFLKFYFSFYNAFFSYRVLKNLSINYFNRLIFFKFPNKKNLFNTAYINKKKKFINWYINNKK